MHPAWLRLMRYCAELGHGEIEKLKIQDGLPIAVPCLGEGLETNPRSGSAFFFTWPSLRKATMTRTWVRAILRMVVSVVALAAAAMTQQYTMTDLGILSSSSGNPFARPGG